MVKNKPYNLSLPEPTVNRLKKYSEGKPRGSVSSLVNNLILEYFGESGVLAPLKKDMTPEQRYLVETLDAFPRDDHPHILRVILKALDAVRDKSRDGGKSFPV